MIQKYKIVSVVYGGTGKQYVAELNERITRLSETERYPISSKLIMESILTQELLTGVMDLFRESEFCVAFLTADDCCVTENGHRKRLRQNVVFELGMAILQLGRERCILLSDFDVHDPSFELPSDMSSLGIRNFTSENYSEVMDEVISKILKMSCNSLISGSSSKTVPQYDHLLQRNEYRVDYENIFVNRSMSIHTEGSAFLKETLNAWLEECDTLPNYDEKCVYLFERIGFLPIFGKIPEAQQWLWKSAEMMEHYHESDVSYYGDTELLDFTSNLISNILEYTKIKMVNDKLDYFSYLKLLNNFTSEPFPENAPLNPLIAVVYYDYLGLTNMKLFQCKGEKKYIEQAQTSFEMAIQYVSKVDMSLKIWAGFLNYNLARAYAAQNEVEKASEYYLKAIRIRERWLKNSSYNITVRNALSSEYFIAKIDYIDMCRRFKILSDEQIEQEYITIEAELNTYCDVDDKLEQLLYVRRLLQMKRKCTL